MNSEQNSEQAGFNEAKTEILDAIGTLGQMTAKGSNMAMVAPTSRGLKRSWVGATPLPGIPRMRVGMRS